MYASPDGVYPEGRKRVDPPKGGAYPGLVVAARHAGTKSIHVGTRKMVNYAWPGLNPAPGNPGQALSDPAMPMNFTHYLVKL